MTVKIRVLYVDDEPDLLDIGRLFLQQTGNFSVETIDSATAALDLLKPEQFDAVISDYQMPGMDGIEFLKTVRSSGNIIPFILFTGKGREEVVIQALNEGADFYLQKGGDPTSQFVELAHKVQIAVSNKRAGEALKKSEEKYRHLIEHANEVIVVAQDGLLKLVNHKATEMTGYSEQELLSIPFSAVIHPDDRTMVMERFQKRLKGGELPGRYPFRVTSRENGICWVEISAVVIEWDGRPATLNFLTDITERKTAEDELKRAYDGLEERVQERTADLNATNLQLQKEIETRYKIESALLESQEGFRTLIEKAPEAIILYDVNLERYIDANEKAEQLFGCSRQELLDSGPQQFYIPDQPDGVPVDESVREHRKQALSGEELIFERRIRNARGEDRIVEVRLIQMRSFNKTLNRSSYIDITERKQMEEALRESEEKFRHIIENSHDIIYTLTSEGVFTFVSPTWTTLLGHPVTQVIGQSFQIFVHPDDIPGCMIFLQSVIESGKRKEGIEYRVRHTDGTWYWHTSSAVPFKDETGRIAGFYGIARDVTERKKAEEALRESEEKFRDFFNNATDAITIHDMQSRIIEVNDVVCRTLGYSREELLMMSAVDIVAPEYGATVDEHTRQITESGIAVFETVQRARDGTGIPTEVIARVITYNGRPAIIATGRDITKRKRAEELLRESEEKYRILSEAAKDIIFIVTRTGTISYVNPAMETFFGIGPQDAMGSNINQVFPPPVAGQQNMYLQQVITTGQPVTIEMVIPVPDGQGWFNTRLVPIFNSDNEIEQVFGIARDITENKRAEETIRSASAYNRSLIEASLDPLVTIDPNGTISDVNAATVKVTGYSREELIGTDFSNYFTEPDKAKAGYEKVFRDGFVTDYELEIRHKEGVVTAVLYNAAVYRDESGTVTGVFAAARDINERKRAEEALRHSEERYREIVEKDYRSILENIQDVFYRSDIHGNLILMSPSGAKLLGYAGTGEMVGKPITEFYLDPSHRDPVLAALEKDGSVSNMEVTLARKDGSPVLVAISSHLYFDADGHYAGVEGILRDITVQKQTVEALQGDKEFFRAIFESSADLIHVLNKSGLITSTNKLNLAITGYSEEDLVGRSLRDFFTPASQELFDKNFPVLVEKGKNRVEVEFICKDGSTLILDCSASVVRDTSGAIQSFVVFEKDITERKKMEEELRKREEIYSKLVEMSSDGIWLIDKEFLTVYVNPAMEEMLGYSKSEMTGRSWYEFGDPEWVQRAKELEKRRKNGIAEPHEFLFIHKDGKRVMTRISTTPLYDNDGSFDGAIGVVSDISRQKIVENALREGEQRFRILFEQASDSIFVADPITRMIIDGNRKAEALTGYSHDELISMQIDALHPEDIRAVTIANFLKFRDGKNDNVDSVVISRDGRLVPVSITGGYIEVNGRAMLLGSFRDITSQKHAEEELRQYQRELEMQNEELRTIQHDLEDSRDRYMDLYDMAPVGYLTTSDKGLVLKANLTASVMLSVERRTLITTPMSRFIVPEDQETYYLHRNQLIRTKEQQTFELMMLRQGGAPFHTQVIMVPAPADEGNGAACNILVIDITERKVAEAALAASEDKYRNIFENSGEAIVVAQGDRVRLVNPRLIEITGYPEEELLKIPFLTYIHPSHHDNIVKIYSRLLKGENDERFPHYPIQLVTREGEIKWVEIGAVAIEWEGQPATLNFLTDITERRQAEEALISAHNDLEQQVKERTANLFSSNLQLQAEIEHRKLIAEALKESAKITSILNEVIITANKTATLHQLFTDSLDKALELLDFEGGGVYLVNQGERTAEIHYTKNLPEEFTRDRQTVLIDVPPYKTLFIDNEPIITEYFEELVPELAKKFNIRSMASIPLVSKNKVIGALNVASSKRYTLSGDERQVLIAIGRELGTSVERMIAENEVKKVSVNLQTLFDSINEMVFVLDMQGHILKVNEAVQKRLCFTQDELLGTDVLVLHIPERQEEALRNVQGMIAGTIDSCPVPIMTKNGGIIEVETKVTRGRWNDQEVLIGVSRDVTERNSMERELMQLSDRLSLAVKAGGVGIWDFDTITNTLNWDDQMFALYGIKREQFSGAYEAWQAGLHPEDRERGDAEIRMALHGEKEFDTEFRVLWPDGTIRTIRALAIVQRDANGKPLRMIGTNWDITDQKNAEETLLQISERLSLAVKAGGIGIWDYDVVNDTLNWDDQMFALYGITREQFGGAHDAWLAGIHPEDRPRQDAEVGMALSGEKSFDTEFRVLWPDGTTRTIRALALVQRDAAGVPLRVIGTNWDITDQKNAEKALRENDILLRLILSLSAQFINISSDKIYLEIGSALGELGRFAGVDRSYVFLLSPDGMTMDNTHEWCAEGIVPEKDNLQGLPTSMFPWWMEKIHRFETIHVPRVADLPPEASNEKEILEAQGIQSVLIVPLISQNTLIGFLGFDSVSHEKTWPDNIIALVTITGKSISNAIERERAEEALRRSEEQLSLALEGSGVGLWDWRVQTGETIFNERWAGILGYTLAELSPVSITTWESLCHPDDLARSGELLESHFSGKTPTYECEARMKHKDGHWVWVLDRGKVVEWDEAGRPVRMTGTHLDITERVHHEVAIAASLREKETLLKEIHHRVKNNMQVISSLLNLQAKKIRDKNTLEIFRESQNRVRSIALIHEKLYRSKSLSQVDFQDFLQQLAENLFLSYGVRKDQVSLDISADEIYLPIDRAIPLGLITNELLTNSLKYAFPDRRKGNISIGLRKEHEHYQYTFHDDGAGFPENIEFDQGTDGNDTAQTLGLQLVIALVGQMQGTVELERGNGSTFEIRFIYEEKGEDQA